MPAGGWVARWVCVGVAIAAAGSSKRPGETAGVKTCSGFSGCRSRQHFAAGPAPAGASEGAEPAPQRVSSHLRQPGWRGSIVMLLEIKFW